MEYSQLNTYLFRTLTTLNFNKQKHECLISILTIVILKPIAQILLWTLNAIFYFKP